LRPGSRDSEERKLVRDLQRKHPQALERISERFGRLLRGYLNDALADAGAAEDVLQLTLIDVWKRGPSYDPERASLSTWLLMIARSRAIDHLRRRVPEPYDPDTMPELVDRETEDQASALIERWRMAGLIATLPKQEATLLRLRFYEGLSQSEIAARTGIPLGTVKMRMVKALERLRDALEAEESTPAREETRR
jgi:RNA polymerase sigma-70 factor (ECF subfamily)